MGPPDDRSSRPLTNDPNFLASLSDLDRGLAAPTTSAAKQTQRELTDYSDFLTTLSDLEQGGAGAEVSSTTPPPPRVHTPLVAAPERRPLLDIFPVEPEGHFADSPVSHQPKATSEPRRPLAQALTYETFYGLHERPFSLSSDLEFLYHGAEYDRITQEMLGAIGQREKFVLLTGELGVGTSMLCRALLEQLDQRTLTSFVAEPFESVTHLLKKLLIDFGVISQASLERGRLDNATQQELAGALRDFLASLAPLQAFAVVIIDEAQNLPAPMLEEIRLMADGGGDEGLIQIVLVGQPSLLTMLGRAELAELFQRISRKCKLGPLGSDEIAGYVTHRLRVAGDSPRVEFDGAALRKAYLLSRGLPRLVNLLCERALVAGFANSASVINEALIEEAAEDLDLAAPLGRDTAVRLAAMVALMLVLVLTGAAAAAYVYRADVARLVTKWENVPELPKAPPLPTAAPYTPPPLPESPF